MLAKTKTNCSFSSHDFRKEQRLCGAEHGSIVLPSLDRLQHRRLLDHSKTAGLRQDGLGSPSRRLVTTSPGRETRHQHSCGIATREDRRPPNGRSRAHPRHQPAPPRGGCAQPGSCVACGWDGVFMNSSGRRFQGPPDPGACRRCRFAIASSTAALRFGMNAGSEPSSENHRRAGGRRGRTRSAAADIHRAVVSMSSSFRVGGELDKRRRGGRGHAIRLLRRTQVDSL